MKQEVPVSVRLGPDLVARLRELAREDERSISGVIRLALREYLERRGREDGRSWRA